MQELTENAEALRLQCLHTMGISLWYPRFILPNALPSRHCALVEEQSGTTDTAVSASNALKEAATGPAPSRKVLVEEKAEQRKIHQPRQIPAAGPGSAPTSNDSETTSAAPFQALFLPVDARLAVLCQIPALARPQLQPGQARLLHNILHWLGYPAPRQSRVFQWPLPGLAGHASGQLAISSLRHFLEQALLEAPATQVLAFGEQVAERVLAGDLPVPCLALHSLDAMLNLPRLKHETWRALLPLHAGAGNS